MPLRRGFMAVQGNAGVSHGLQLHGLLKRVRSNNAYAHASAHQLFKRAHHLELHLLEILEVPLAALDAQVFNRPQ